MQKPETLKEEGNDHLRADRFELALECYSQALEQAQHGATEKIRFDLHSNRLQALIKLRRFSGSEHNAALRYVLDHMNGYDPGPWKMAKILYRCAIIFDYRGDPRRSMYCIHQSGLYAPHSEEVGAFRRKIEEQLLQSLSDDGFLQRGVAEEIKGSSTECATCLSELTGQYVQYPCNHVYHEECFVSWVETGSPNCPLCRRSFTTGNGRLEGMD